MSLETTINNDIKVAMRAKDKETLRALRAVKSNILLAKTAEGANSDGLTPEQEIKMLAKMVKQRKDSAATYTQQGREDLAAVELREVETIEKYLPKQLSEEELKQNIQAIINDLGASSMKDMGRVMGVASKQFAGKADGKLVAATVRALLS